MSAAHVGSKRQAIKKEVVAGASIDCYSRKDSSTNSKQACHFSLVLPGIVRVLVAQLPSAKPNIEWQRRSMTVANQQQGSSSARKKWWS